MPKVKKAKEEKESIPGFFWSVGTVGGFTQDYDEARRKAETWGAVSRYLARRSA